MGTTRNPPGLGAAAYFGGALRPGGLLHLRGRPGRLRALPHGSRSRPRPRPCAPNSAWIEAELARKRNLAHRLSDAYLDLDLLDSRGREILGYVRPDEIVLR